MLFVAFLLFALFLTMELDQSADVEENIHTHSESNSFDTIIGEIEDIIMGEFGRVMFLVEKSYPEKTTKTI